MKHYLFTIVRIYFKQKCIYSYLSSFFKVIINLMKSNKIKKGRRKNINKIKPIQILLIDRSFLDNLDLDSVLTSS
jgi:hypothetical protein